ncbi:MAG: hypothetical protein MI685_09180 [Chlorobiales bacterium]|nr:hypothetical protein [Chlorobiales bacterium]
MIGFAKFVNFVLALAVFGFLRVATAEMGTAAWAVSLAVAIIAFYLLRAMLVSPLLKSATNKASTQIIQHFAGGGDMGGAIKIAKRLGLNASEAQNVAAEHKDALVREIADRILKEARHRYEKRKDKDEVRRYLQEQGVPEKDIEMAVDRVVEESK